MAATDAFSLSLHGCRQRHVTLLRHRLAWPSFAALVRNDFTAADVSAS